MRRKRGASYNRQWMKLLTNRWDEAVARSFGAYGLRLLAYRSNLLGADLRITNFGGGNTSSKLDLPDPVTGKPVRVLAVKGSGGDLGSIEPSGFALLDLDRLLLLESRYRGEEHEDEMASLYALCAFGDSKAPPSIDTPLHAFLPYPHVDHLHPDWAIALAASANGRQKLDEFNRRFDRRLAWLPWQRPGFELGLMLRRAVEENPGCDGLVLANHGLFTWGETQRQCYENSVGVIDDLGQFVREHEERRGTKLFGGARHPRRTAVEEEAIAILPYLRGRLATTRRSIAHYDGSPEMIEFVNAVHAKQLAELGTSCPDHFIRTRIRPMYVEWDAARGSVGDLKLAIDRSAAEYRESYAAYYLRCASPDSPPLRDPNPSVVLIPGIGMVTFGRTKAEARITGEFYINAKNVIRGATALGTEDDVPASLPQAKTLAAAARFTSFGNYVALPPEEAFRIEYWSLEEAKLQRMPPENELSRRIFFVERTGTALGRSVAIKLAGAGAHVMLAGLRDETIAAAGGREAIAFTDLGGIDALKAAVLQFGGLDGIVCDSGSDALTAAGPVFEDQGLSATVVLAGDLPVHRLPTLVRSNAITRRGGMIWSDTTNGTELAAEVALFLASDRSAALRSHSLPLDIELPEAN